MIADLKEKTKAAPRFELGNGGFADLCLTTWLCRRLVHLFDILALILNYLTSLDFYY